MHTSFDCDATYRLANQDQLVINAAVTEEADLAYERKAVLQAICTRDGDVARVTFTVSAADADEARARAETLYAALEASVRGGHGEGALERIGLTVEPTPESPADLEEDAKAVYEAFQRELARRKVDAEGPSTPIEAPYAAMRAVHLNGDNYGKGTEAIIAGFQALEARARFHFVEIGGACATLVFDELPEDVEGFAAAAYELCPDLDNEVESLDDFDTDDDELIERMALEGLAALIREEKLLRFWWD